MKRIFLQHLVDVPPDIMGELRIHFIQNILAVEQRPHFPHRLIADSSDNPSHVIEHHIGGSAFVPPVLLSTREFVGDRMPFTGLLVREGISSRRLMLHIVDARTDIDQRLQHRIRGDVLDALAVDVHFAAIAN